jgi:hypothetical protein
MLSLIRHRQRQMVFHYATLPAAIFIISFTMAGFRCAIAEAASMPRHARYFDIIDYRHIIISCFSHIIDYCH